MKFRSGLAALALLAAPVHAQAPTFTITDGRLELPAAIEFEDGDDVFANKSAAGLQHIADFLAAKPYITLLRIETNAASYPDRRTNIALGVARAQRIGKWLKALGVDCRRVMIVTFGPDKPAAAGKDPSNERTEVRPAALNGRAIGGLPLDGGGLAVGDACPYP